jgi:hypothetical protein
LENIIAKIEMRKSIIRDQGALYHRSSGYYRRLEEAGRAALYRKNNKE